MLSRCSPLFTNASLYFIPSKVELTARVGSVAADIDLTSTSENWRGERYAGGIRAVVVADDGGRETVERAPVARVQWYSESERVGEASSLPGIMSVEGASTVNGSPPRNADPSMRPIERAEGTAVMQLRWGGF